MSNIKKVCIITPSYIARQTCRADVSCFGFFLFLRTDLLLSIIASASTDVSGDESAAEYSEMSAILGFLAPKANNLAQVLSLSIHQKLKKLQQL